jgi:hypothetical protein
MTPCRFTSGYCPSEECTALILRVEYDYSPTGNFKTSYTYPLRGYNITHLCLSRIWRPIFFRNVVILVQDYTVSYPTRTHNERSEQLELQSNTCDIME